MGQDNIKEMLHSYYSMPEEERSKIDINSVEALRSFVNLPDSEKEKVNSEMGWDLPFKKKESSAGSLTGSENTTPLQSTSTSEIPTVQITDGEIDAAPLNRPSTMPYGTKMGEDGKVMSDTNEDRRKRAENENRTKRINFLKQKTAQNFKENPELYSDPKNRDNYYTTLLKFYKPEDVAEIIGDDKWKDEGGGLITTTYRPNPITGESDLYHEDSNNAIKHPFQTIGEATGESLVGAKEKIQKAHETLSPLPQDQLKAGLGMTAGVVQGAMGIGNIAVPEFALFTLGTKQAEESLPVINKVMAPLASALESHYKKSGKQPPSWMEDAASLGDFAWNIALFKGAMKAGEKLSFADVDRAIKTMSPSDIETISSKISEKYNAAQNTEQKSTENVVPKMNEDAGELFKQNDVAMEEANNLSSQAETLKADLEKAKGTPAEPIIAQKIEELNTKIDEIHGKEVERQTAEAHTLSTLDHLQKQREQLVATQESLSPEGQKAIEPEIKKVDEMIKEIEPKEEAKETVPDNEVVEPIRQLGTGANVYFETDKYRVNDNLKSGKVLLNVGDAKGEMPLRNVEFDTPEEAVFVAKKLQENAPNGLDSDFHNVDKIIENYKEEYRQPKNEPVVEGLMNRVGERKPTEGHYGSGENVKFTDNVAVPFRYKVIEADHLQPSHLPSGERNPNHQISLAQPKERNDAASKQAQDKIASNPNLAEVGEGPNAFFGAPVVNKAGEVIHGNNRSIGIKKHYGQKGSSYKSQLSENAEKFGLTKDQVEGMENPVLVREVAVDDNTSVQLGNFDVKDLETGGKQRIDPIVTVRKMSPESKSSLSSIVFDGDHKTVKEAIRSNIGKVAEIIKKYINPAQFAKAFNKAGEITESGMDDISSVVNHFLFDKGDPVLPEAFSQIPDVIQKGLQKSLKYIMGSPEGKSILPETQNAVLAIYEWKQSGVADFNEWANQTDMFKGVTPKDVLSPLELELAKKLSEAKNQSDISKVFAEYNDLVSDKPADMFNDATPGLSHNDAVKKQFKLNEYERTENKPERHTEAPSIEIPVDATPKEVSREKPEPTKEPEAIKDSGELTSINDALSDSKDYTGIKESIKESDANKFREIQETTSEAVKKKRMDNLSPEELHIEKNYGEIIKQLKASGLLEGPCI